MSEELSMAQIAVHAIVALCGIAVAAFLLLARRKLGWGALADFVNWTSIGLIVLSFFHLFEDSIEFIEKLGGVHGLGEIEFFGEHAIIVAGVAIVFVGALELQKLSNPIKA